MFVSFGQVDEDVKYVETEVLSNYAPIEAQTDTGSNRGLC